MPPITLTAAHGTTTTVRPIERTTPDGRRYVTVSSRSFRDAMRRLGGGTFAGEIDRAPGFSGWTQTETGGLIAWELPT